MRKLFLDDAVCELLNVSREPAELFDKDGGVLGLYLPPPAMEQESTEEKSLVGMKEEYPALRQEILYWQNFRFVLLGASIALVSGVMAFGSRNAGAPGDLWGISLWTLISAFLLATLMLAAALSLYAARGNAMTAAYLTTFYGETTKGPCPDPQTAEHFVGKNWDSRLVRFKSSLSPLGSWIEKSRLNHWLALIYLLLGLVSVTLPFVARNQANVQGGERAIDEWVIVGAMALLLIITLFALCVPAPRDRYLEIWRAIKRSEQNS